MLLYEKIVTVDKNTHKNIRVAPVQNYLFAAGVNVIPLAAIEFAHAACEYPIAFARQEDNSLVALAVVGLRENENLFVSADGSWLGRYIPAYVRRYPFVPGQVQKGKAPVVCIDTAYAGYDDDNGEALFVQDGEPSAFLQNAMDLIGDYQGHLILTGDFVKKLDEYSLLKTINVEIKASAAGQAINFTGLEVVDETKLQQLDQEQVMSLFKGGLLLAIYSQLISQANFSALASKLTAKNTEQQGTVQ